MCHRGVLPQQQNWSDSISRAADLEFQKSLMSSSLTADFVCDFCLSFTSSVLPFEKTNYI